jgi:hypothetical protein
VPGLERFQPVDFAGFMIDKPMSPTTTSCESVSRAASRNGTPRALDLQRIRRAGDYAVTARPFGKIRCRPTALELFLAALSRRDAVKCNPFGRSK